MEKISARHKAVPADGQIGPTVVLLHQQPMKSSFGDDEKSIGRPILGRDEAQELASARINLKRADTAHFSREVSSIQVKRFSSKSKGYEWLE